MYKRQSRAEYHDDKAKCERELTGAPDLARQRHCSELMGAQDALVALTRYSQAEVEAKAKCREQLQGAREALDEVVLERNRCQRQLEGNEPASEARERGEEVSHGSAKPQWLRGDDDAAGDGGPNRGGKRSRRKRTKKSRTIGGKKSRKQRKRTTLKGGKRKRRRTRRRR